MEFTLNVSTIITTCTLGGIIWAIRLIISLDKKLAVFEEAFRNMDRRVTILESKTNSMYHKYLSDEISD